MARRPKALLITYTMADPHAVGVFFRALRIVKELVARGWDCTVYNYGPIPVDPKVDEVSERCTITRFHSDNSDRDFPRILADYRRLAPDVVVFGEYPLTYMESLLRAACALVKPPVVMLDQYYSPQAGAHFRGVDAYIMYGVRSLWPHHRLMRANRVIPPFIDAVTPRDALPVPERLHSMPWITIVGFDPRVLRAGIDIAAQLQDVPFGCISMSADPAAAERMFDQAGIAAGRRAALPLQPDAHYFGLIAGSLAVILANGFMQFTEAIALGCPALCIHRGIGMDGFMLYRAFRPYVKFPGDAGEGAEHVRRWLGESPFSDVQLAALEPQRGGVGVLADAIADAVARPRRVARAHRRVARSLQILSSLFPSRVSNANETA